MGNPTEELDPTLHRAINCDWIGGWNCDPDVTKLVYALTTELQFEKRYRLWQDIHRLFWERVPVIHYGHRFGLLVVRKHVHGQFDMFPHYLWNVRIEK